MRKSYRERSNLSNPVKPKKWIQAANIKEGAFTKKAKAADMSIPAFATKVLKKGSKATTKTKKQAVLAKTLTKLAKRKK